MAAASSTSAAIGSVELKHTFEFTCDPNEKSSQSSSFLVTNSTHFSQQLVLSGGPSITCSLKYFPDDDESLPGLGAHFVFSISWSEAIFKCSTEAFILEHGKRYSCLGKFDCSNGNSQRVNIEMEDDDDSIDDDSINNNPFTILLVVSATGSVEAPSRAVSARNLSADYEKMLSSELFSDVEVKCEDRTFKCHKTVLAHRSDVFAAMLSDNFKEGQNNAIEVKEMDADILQILLLYIYSGKIEERNVSVALLRAADFYNIEGLVKECCVVLGKDVNFDNCCDILAFAHLKNDKKFFGKAVAFFKKNKEALMTSPKWKKIESLSLFDAILRQM